MKSDTDRAKRLGHGLLSVVAIYIVVVTIVWSVAEYLASIR